jgi:Tfp pilus assembly protein PilO
MDLQSPQTRQKILLAILLSGGLGYVGFQYGYMPKAAEIASLERRLQALEDQSRSARLVAEQNGSTSIESQLQRLQEQLTQAEQLIPSGEEVADLLDAISTEAERAGVNLSRIQPVGASTGDFYTKRTYDLAVTGSYHEIGDFLTRIGSLPRTITPTMLNLIVIEEAVGSGNPTLEARFAIETYVLPDRVTVEDAVEEQ